MNRKSLLFLILAFVVSPFAALAQSLLVTGRVVSSDDGYGLPGVTIQVKGTATGTVTDLDGNYSLTADSQDVLVFSFVGYKTKEIAIKDDDDDLPKSPTPPPTPDTDPVADFSDAL